LGQEDAAVGGAHVNAVKRLGRSHPLRPPVKQTKFLAQASRETSGGRLILLA
jgi:hypothetical protein